MRLVTSINLDEGVRTRFNVSDHGFGLVGSLYLENDTSEVLIQAKLDELDVSEYFDAVGLATDLEAFADALRQAAS